MTILSVSKYVLVGTLIGGLYFVLLYYAVQQQVGKAARFRILPLHLLRTVLALAAFWAIAQQGPFPLLLCLGGFLMARLWALRQFGVT